MRLQDTLDLLRRDVESAGLDHVLAPIPEEQVALRVDADDVAGVHPAALEDLRGALRVLEVAEHDRRCATEQLALVGVVAVGVDDPDLQVTDRLADPGRVLVRSVFEPPEPAHRAALGELGLSPIGAPHGLRGGRGPRVDRVR